MSDLGHERDLRAVDRPGFPIPSPRVGKDDQDLGVRLAMCGLLLRPDARLSDLVRGLADGEKLRWYAPTGRNSRLDEFAGPRNDVVLQVGVQMRTSGKPSWVDCLSDLGVPLPPADEDAQEPAVLVAVTTRGPDTSSRTVLWCFGRISQSVPTEPLDRRFGLVVALNKHVISTPAESWRPLPTRLPRLRRPVDPKNQVRAVESEVTRGHPHRSTARGASPSPLEGLRFDLTSDQVRRVTLGTEDPLIGQIEGGRALRFTTYIHSLDDFVGLTQHALEMHGRRDYQRDWAWIDHSMPVAGRNKIDEVLNVLYERIRNKDELLIDLMIPDLALDHSDPNIEVTFALPHERGLRRPSLSWADVETWLRTRTQLARWGVPLRHIDVRVQVDAEEHKIPLTALLVAEVPMGDSTFLVSDGDVLRVEKSYLEQVDSYVEDIPWSDFPFPLYKGGTEGSYLDHAVDILPERLAKIDLRDIRLPGETAFETCDLFSDDMRLIYAKIKGPTSRFSHLCTQAETAATVFNRSASARQQLMERVGDATGRIAIREAADRVAGALASGRAKEVTVTPLLLGSWRTRTLRTLPLASKQRLRSLAMQLRSLGYRLEVASPAERAG